jgi:putative ABC transport system permease protein
MWQPLAQSPGLTASRRDARRLGAVGRLRADVSPAQARAELTTIATRLADAYPGTNARTSAIVYPLKDLSGDIPAPILAALVGAVSIVLLVCWSNLASLLLARGVTRARDLAIRSALGASRSRILRQLLFESACLAGAGALLGFGLALAGIRQLVIAIGVIEPGSGPILPYWVDVSPSVWVWGFVFGLAVASSVAFGLLPAWHLSRVNPQTVLASVGRTSTSRDTRRWTSALLVGQLALAMVLLFVAGLLWRGFLQAVNADPVMQTARLVAMRMNLPAAKYADPLKRRQFLEQLDERLSAHPAVDAAAMGSHIPIEFGGPVREIEIDGVPRARDDARPLVMFIQAGDGYTETIGVPIVRGRNLEPGDEQPGREAVVIDQALATRDFQGADPIGRRIRLHVVTASGPRPPSLKGDDPDPAPWFTIVGVTRTVPQSGPRPLVRPVAYARFRADPYPDPRIVLLARGDVAAVSAVLREEVRQLDASLPLYAIEPVVETLARQRFPTRLVGTWFTTFAGVALVMAVVGLFALTAHGVAQRRHEIGVRMAVGARGDQVVWLFLRRTVTQLAVALALGCAGALGVGGLLTIYLGETNPRDPLTLMIVIALLSGVAILSAAVPARRAARVDPAVVLRAE